VTVVEFLQARLDERAEVAHAFAGRCWYACDDGCVEEWHGETWDGSTPRLPNHHNSWWVIYDADAELREVAAKGRIIELHHLEVRKLDVPPFDALTGKSRPDEYEVTCDVCGWASDTPTSGCLTLRLLALADDSHPSYDLVWRP
jgi:hypothetical protein